MSSTERGKSVTICLKHLRRVFIVFFYLLGYSVVRRIYCSALGICGPDTSLKVKLLKLLDIGLPKFSSVGWTLGSVEQRS